MSAAMDDPLLDAALDAALERAPDEGWTRAMLRRAVTDAGSDPELAESLFPRGPVSAIAAWSRRSDQRMEQAAGDLSGLRTPERIRRVIEARLTEAEPHREALRGALAVLATPWNLGLAATLTAETVSAMWYAAGDSSADFSWYTRRATLAGVYGATLAYWMSPSGPDLPETLAFLDRRLADLPKPRRKPEAA
ncbi:MAG: COQ9 family protein [Acetobacteraceae bacterium]|nr:COQ9 family protein [Acetobacteraceae bacterium]